ncbi:bacteriophage CI repressor [Agrobacterium larrymoorei]|uniref:helix-turn-helix domain-containing protein n=1 Tax=Agrobacterium larrymoorei TaxID=160699 RepID=UPI0015749996|nr:helix-turn-helix domain-containing protein [Agrobacterium larrymoorei]NTJ42578.1 bacteriophage CI repressor [Agrobacterium larrymoorei]
MRTYDANAVIDRAKSLWALKQDQELADMLEVSRTTLASWKRRNSIPTKYLFKMIWGLDTTMDWLLTGKEDESVDDYGFSKKKPLVDDRIFWLSLLLLRLQLSDGTEKEKKIAELLDDNDLMGLHINLSNLISVLNDTKEKWLKSGIVKEKDVYRAIATEYGLSIGFGTNPPPTWWDD